MPDSQSFNQRILLVAPSLRIMGGQAVQADRLLNKMRSEGMSVDLLPINPRPPGILRHAEKVKYLRTLVVSFFYVLSLIRLIPRYDLIHIFSASYFSFILAPTPAIIVARFFGKPTLLNYRSGEAEDHLQRWGVVVFHILRLVDVIVTPSGYLVEVFGRFGFQAEPIVNFVDEGTVNYRLRTKIQPRLIVARALEPLYNVACAIRAYQFIKEKYPRAELTILGEGSQEAELKEMVSREHISGVTFVGRVERDQIGKLYNEADVFLNSSSIDNMPVSILEAFAAGLPVVTTDAGGIPFIVTDRVNGYLVDIDDHVALAERVIGLVEKPEEVERLSRQGAEESKRYRWNVVSGKWRDIYSRTIQAHRPGAGDSQSAHASPSTAPGSKS